jgi:hypothetical protein
MLQGQEGDNMRKVGATPKVCREMLEALLFPIPHGIIREKDKASTSEEGSDPLVKVDPAVHRRLA